MKTINLTISQECDLLVLVAEKIEDLQKLKTSAMNYACQKDIDFLTGRIADYERIKNILL